MEDSNIKELYEFLKNYDLIQTELDQEEAESYITSIFETLNPDESLLTGFIADIDVNGEKKPSALFITSEDRLLTYPQIEGFPEDVKTSDVEFIDEDSDTTLKLKLKDNDQEFIINAANVEGIDTINDALYSSFAESLNDEELSYIFGEEFEEDEDELEEEEEKEAVEEPEEEIEEVIPVVGDETTEVEVIEEEPEPVDLVPQGEELLATENNDMVVSETSLETPPENEVAFTTQNDTVSPSSSFEATQGEDKEKKGFHLNKAMKFTIGGIVILALILGAYLIYNRVMVSRANNEMAQTLVDYLNQSDEIYFTLKDDQNANFANVTVEQMDQLNTQCQTIADSLLELETNEDTDQLYQNIYFYNDALLSAIYYGRVYINTQNQLNKLSFDSMLDAAYRYRIAILKLLRSDYPDLLDSVEREPNMDMDAEYAQSGENSTPSEGALNRENSTSSQNFENSVSSREQYLNSMNSSGVSK